MRTKKKKGSREQTYLELKKIGVKLDEEKDPITKQPEYTEKRKNFARLYVDNYFQMAYKTNQIAIEAGYSKDSDIRELMSLQRTN